MYHNSYGVKAIHKIKNFDRVFGFNDIKANKEKEPYINYNFFMKFLITNACFLHILQTILIKCIYIIKHTAQQIILNKMAKTSNLNT